MNVPYVKQYDENGVVTNTIKERLLHSEPNRQSRRNEFKKQRPNNLRKRTNGRVVQSVNDKTIRHETENAISRKVLLLNFFERILTLKSKWHKSHPEYQKKSE